jgi:hypothetical protein
MNMEDGVEHKHAEHENAGSLAGLVGHLEEEEADWRFGGLATVRSATPTPVCKHILAAVLAKAAPRLFSNGVTEKAVTPEELMGWGAGWGEFGYG